MLHKSSPGKPIVFLYHAADIVSVIHQRPVNRNLNHAVLTASARVGFRDVRIVETANLIKDGYVNLDEIDKMDLEDARSALQVLPGVGPKVADCILLFAFDRKESFPVDVWIKRVMEELYLKEVTPKSKIAMRGREVFGKNAGFANQYLFYYGRENKLGK